MSDLTIDYENELNSSQLQAVRNIKGPQLVIAGAGSGKTRTLVYRVAYLIEKGIDPSRILLLTFTRKSAQEMMRRAHQILDKRCLDVFGGTFHSIANTFLRKYSPKIGFNNNFTIIDQGDAQDIINLIRTRLNIAKGNKAFPKKNTIYSIISKVANTHRTYQDVILDDYPKFIDETESIQKIGDYFKEYKQENSMMDYDDLLAHFSTLLYDHEEVRQKLSSRFQYIMVDEFQDTNRLQAQIACLLASTHGNILVVGDDSQSIYSFRGANFRNIMDFPAIFDDCQVTKLEQNYRSTQPILEFTNEIIKNAKEKYTKTLFSEIKGDTKPYFSRFDDGFDQADFVRSQILELREKDVPLNDMAVLFRAGWHSNELEIRLNESLIPFAKFGGLKFAESAHIKDLLAYLRITVNTRDEVAWLRLLLLIEGIGPKTAQTIIQHIINDSQGILLLLAPKFQNKKYGKDLSDLYNTLSKLQAYLNDPKQAIQESVDHYQNLLEQNYDDHHRRQNDLQTLTNMSNQYRNLVDFLSTLTLDPIEISKLEQDENGEQDILTLSTIHSSKGLEWDTVFIIYLVDGRFPSAQSLQNPDDIEEERRLFYVAATRAKKRLFLLTPNLTENGYNRFYSYSGDLSNPSKFISEIKNFSFITDEIIIDENNYDDSQETEDADPKNPIPSYFNQISKYFN